MINDSIIDRKQIINYHFIDNKAASNLDIAQFNRYNFQMIND